MRILLWNGRGLSSLALCGHSIDHMTDPASIRGRRLLEARHLLISTDPNSQRLLEAGVYWSSGIN